MRALSAILALSALLIVSVWADNEKLGKAPNFTSDAVWIDTGAGGNKPPHSIKGYRGQVLLIDFWEYTCINCIRDFSVLKRWYAKYHPDGLDIVGVHYGEFKIGFSSDNVREAARRFGLPWPVVADINGSIWHEYHSDVWPNRYLIDQNGDIVLQIEGEGHDRPLEEKIRELLAKEHPEVNQIPLDPPESSFLPSCGKPTEETYVGDWFGHGEVANANGYKDDGRATEFRAQGEPADGKVMLSGEWTTQQDGVTSGGKHEQAQLRYHARSVYAVLSVENPKKPVRVDVLQDGKVFDSGNAGVDVHIDSQGSYLEVSSPRMYYLVKNPQFGSHLLTLESQAAGFALHSFTYGNNCQQDFEQK